MESRRLGRVTADGLSIGRIVLLPLQLGLQIPRRKQPHIIALGNQFSSPIMRGTACLDPDEASGQILEQPQDAPTGQLPPDDNLASRIHTVHLKDRLGDIQTNRRRKCPWQISSSSNPRDYSRKGWRAVHRIQKRTGSFGLKTARSLPFRLRLKFSRLRPDGIGQLNVRGVHETLAENVARNVTHHRPPRDLVRPTLHGKVPDQRLLRDHVGSHSQWVPF